MLFGGICWVVNAMLVLVCVAMTGQSIRRHISTFSPSDWRTRHALWVKKKQHWFPWLFVPCATPFGWGGGGGGGHGWLLRGWWRLFMSWRRDVHFDSLDCWPVLRRLRGTLPAMCRCGRPWNFGAPFQLQKRAITIHHMAHLYKLLITMKVPWMCPYLYLGISPFCPIKMAMCRF